MRSVNEIALAAAVRAVTKRALAKSWRLMLGVFCLGLATQLRAQDAEPAFVRPDKTRGWPIYYREAYPDGRSETHALFSLYYRSLRTDGSSLFLTPFYYNNRERQENRSWSILLPLYYSTDSDRGWEIWSLPLSFGGWKSSAGGWLWVPGILPLFSSDRYPEDGDWQARLGFPALLDLVDWDRRRDRARFTAVSIFPGWSSRPKALVWHERAGNGQLEHSHLFPAYAYAADRYFTLPWLGWLRTWGDDSTRDWVLPLLGRLDRDPEGYSWAAALGLFGGGRREERSWLRFEPLFRVKQSGAGAGSIDIAHLYGRSWDSESGVSVHRVLEPLGEFESHPDGFRHRFLPFYFAGRNQGSAYWALAPLYFSRQTPERSTRIIFPLYFSQHAASDHDRVFFPLYWDHATETTRHVTLLPIYHRWSSPKSRLDLVLGPAYVRYARPEEGLVRHSVLWPLASFSRSDEGRHSHVLPLYWSDRRGEDRLDLITPLYLRASGANYSHHWLVPVYGSFRRTLDESGATLRRSFYAAGLVVNSQTRDRDQTLETTRTHVLGPLMGYSRDRARDSTHSRVLPLWWQDRSPDLSLTILAPVYMHARTPELEQRWLLPVWGSLRSPLDDARATREWNFYAAGVLASRKDTEADGSTRARAHHLLGPLMGYSRDTVGDRTHSRVLPVWWRDQAPQRSLTLVGGSLWFSRVRGEVVDRGVAWPLTWYHRDPRQSWFQAFGLYHHRSVGQERSQLRLTPLLNLDRGAPGPTPPVYRWLHLYARESGDWGSRNWFLPGLADIYRHPEGYRWSALAGVVGAERSEGLSHSRLLPIYWRTRQGPAGEKPTRTFTAIFPLYYDSIHDGGQSFAWSILFPLLLRNTRADGGYDQAHPWPLFTIRRTPESLRINAFLLTGLYRNPERSSWWAWPIAYQNEIHREVRGPWSEDGYRTLALFRRSTGPSSATTVVQPFLFAAHHDHQNDVREWNGLLSTIRYCRRGESSRYHALGLLWGASSPERSWHSLFPISYSRSDATAALPHYTLPQVFHLYSRLEDTESARWSFLWFLVRSEKSRSTEDHEFRILHRLVLSRQRGTFEERVFEPFRTWEEDPSTGYFYHSILKFVYVSSRQDYESPIKRRVFGLSL